MLAYALGRNLNDYDKCAPQRDFAEPGKKDCRFSEHSLEIQFGIHGVLPSRF
jgi:hypothetical protein